MMADRPSFEVKNSDIEPIPQEADIHTQQILQLQESMKEQLAQLSILGEQTRIDLLREQKEFHAQLTQAYASLGNEMKGVLYYLTKHLSEQPNNQIHHRSDVYSNLKEAGAAESQQELGQKKKRSAKTLTMVLNAFAQITFLAFGIFTVWSWAVAVVANSKAETSNLIALASLCTSGLSTQNVSGTDHLHEVCASFLIRAMPHLSHAAKALAPSPFSALRGNTMAPGFDESQRIPLGAGIGIGVPTLIVAIAIFFLGKKYRKDS